MHAPSKMESPYLFLVLLLFALDIPCCVSERKGKVILTQIVFRHGDRTPMASYPNDPHLNYWRSQGFMQLTNAGKKQLLELGTYLRHRYNSLLGSTYNFSEILVNSSDTDRTLMSAYSMLTGLYQISDGHPKKDEFPWQLIPVHTRPIATDYIVADGADCPSYVEELNDIMNSPLIKEVEAENAKLLSVFNTYAGIPVTRFRHMYPIFDTIDIEKLHNMAIPSWAEPEYDRLHNLSHLRFRWSYSTAKSQRLRGGPMLSHMITNMHLRINGSNEHTKVFLFSSHDELISAFLMALGIFNNLTPPFASAVIVDLLETKPGEYGVEIYYRNNSRMEPQLLTIPYCTSYCPIDEFVMLTRSVIPADILEECGVASKFVKHLSATVTAVLLCQTVVMMMFAIGCIYCWNKQRKIQYRYAKFIDD